MTKTITKNIEELGRDFHIASEKEHDYYGKLERLISLYPQIETNQPIEDQVAQLMKEAGSRNRLEAIEVYGEWRYWLGVAITLFKDIQECKDGNF